MSYYIKHRYYRTKKAIVFKEDDIYGRIICYPIKSKSGVKIHCWLWKKKFVSYVKDFVMEKIAVFERCYKNGCRKNKGCSEENNFHLEVHLLGMVNPTRFSDIDSFLNKIMEIADKCDIKSQEIFESYNVPREYGDMLIHGKIMPLPSVLFSRCSPETTEKVNWHGSLQCLYL